ncbi:MAG: hypothetical protein K0U76_02800 [Actinomycetia bacterium]|nr:hypothetical protein [Actinomycetes bacterium]MCH9761863.1 hypothetical protein [Actinomycetes bacterium]
MDGNDPVPPGPPPQQWPQPHPAAPAPQTRRWMPAGHGSSDITRRHYVERAVEVPDYTAALDAYSRSFRGVEADSDADAGGETPSEMG